ncbi:hypothetical protein BH11PLA2_BH11PLA2_01640 [soil metagenome]
MTTIDTTEFFDTRTRNWRARQAISVALMRELSRFSDPHEMFIVFSRRMGQIFPTSRQLTLSRRGVEPPDTRVTRFNLWDEVADPYANWGRFPVYRSELFAELLYADEPRVIDDLHLEPNDPATEFLMGQHSLLAIPIFEQGVAHHTVVLTREESNAFPPEQVPELVWMSNLFGRAMQTQVLTRALQAAVAATDEETRAIAELQESLLPAETPTLPQLELAAHYRTAHRAGGDYYDFFPQSDGSIGVLIADVSGHGTPAAVLMAITHSIAHAANAPTGEPGAFLSHLNRHLAGRYNRVSGSFVTAFYAVFNAAKGTITYASAGHIPPRVVRASNSLTSLNRVQRLPLGISLPDGDYPQAEATFQPGDSVVMVTDGVTEAVNPSGNVFGIDRLNTILSRGVSSASDVLVRVVAEMDRFAAGIAQADDRTVVVAHHTG